MLTSTLIAFVTSGMLQSGGQIIESPSWARVPNAQELSRVGRTEIPREGSVQLLCTLQADGALNGCVIESLTPAQSGLGAEALRLARYYRHQPRLDDGRPVTGLKVRFTIRWRDVG